MDLSAYRARAEAFVAELGAAHHAHFAGLSEDFAVEETYARHASLFDAAAVSALRERAAAAADAGGAREDEARRLRMLLDFAVEGFLGRATAREEEALAHAEASLRLDVPGGPVGFRESVVAQANEPDAARRAALEAARLEATERTLNPLHREALERTRALVRELGWPTYRAMCEELKGWDLGALGRDTDAFLAATDAAYPDVVEPALRRALGTGLDATARADLPRFFRAPEEDAAFPADGLVPAYAATLAGMGLTPDAGGRVDVDLEPRPGKSPRAFCVPVRAPQDVRLVVAPVGGRDDYVALLHEGGHAQHFAHVDPALAFEYRHLGDNAVTEAFAFLFDHLAEDPAWLRARLGVRDADGTVAAHARASRLIYLRRYAAKLSYELIVHGDGAPGDGLLREAYARALGGALRIAWPGASYLADLDPGFYVAAYLRAWALEAQLRRWMAGRFGEAWFAVPDAGEALRRLWADGQRLSAEELLAEVAGERLDFGALVADLGIAVG